MAFCSTCGTATTPGQRFCTQCGSTIVAPPMSSLGETAANSTPAPISGQPAYAQTPYQQPGYGQEYPPAYGQGYGPAAGGVGADPTLAQFDVQYPPRLSRLLNNIPYLKVILALPHAILLYLYAIAAGLVTFIAWWVILFTGRYPPGMFNFVVRFLRYSSNLNAYLNFMRDEYPPFTGAEGAYAPVWLVLGYPSRLSRGLIFIKWLLLIPHMVVLSLLSLAAGVCTFIAWWSILFTGRYPEGMFGFVVGVHRWGLRVGAYFLLLTDRYPPFTLAATPEATPGQYATA